MYLRLLLIVVFLSFFSNCSRNKQVYVPTELKDPYVLYEEGHILFSRNDFFNANKKFSEAELNFDDINLAAKSAIMSCFSLYGINFYNEDSLFDDFIFSQINNKLFRFNKIINDSFYFDNSFVRRDENKIVLQ